ncbi:Hypothetical protein DHA2_150164 [Giardia duodenalis]|uniref:Uncharacterized protein n=1 Tax=Giardia intestinalis TaxID=5741 RepID=V6TPC2_GIAIN|nr:Hypothetical protein DHA2_150164 [Giardia intestinalis]
MDEYASALLAAKEENYEAASKSLQSGLEEAYRVCSELHPTGRARGHPYECRDSNGPVLLLASLHTLNGSILYRQQQWTASLGEYMTARRLLQRTLNATTRLQTAFLANCIGKCHLQLGSYSEGISHLEKGVQHAMSTTITYTAGSEEERASITRDVSIILAGLHTTLSCCYIQLRKPVEALIHAKFVHRRLEACFPETDDHARASVLLAECIICADNGSRATFTKALGLLDKAARVYRQLLKASRADSGEPSWEQQERVLWLLNTYYLISRVLLFTNCKRDAELYAYKAEKLAMIMRLRPNDTIYIKINELIYCCRHGIPYTSSMRKEAPDTAIERDLHSLLASDTRERLKNDPNLAATIRNTAHTIQKSDHGMPERATRPASAPFLTNPEKFNLKPAQLLADMDRRGRILEGLDYYSEMEKKSQKDGDDPDEVARLIRRYKTIDIKPYAPLK